MIYQKRLLKHKQGLHELESDIQKKLLEASVNAEERERQRFSQNLHDDIGPSLNLMKLNLEMLRKSAANGIEQALSDNIEYLNQTIEQIRNMGRNILPPTLRNMGLITALNELGNKIENATGISVLINSQLEEEFRLEEQTELHLYRAIKEILNNIIKYSHTEHITITPNRFFNQDNSVPGQFHLEVNYTGLGLTNEEVIHYIRTGSGNGLKNIQSRISILGGDINYSRLDDVNCLIHISIPLYETTR